MPCNCYILKCGDGSYYIGSTRDLRTRLVQHQAGRVRTTSRRLPVELIYQETFPDYRDAAIREKQLKSWKSRHALERLIHNNKALSSSG